MELISPGLSSWDISFSVTDDHMDRDHFFFLVSIDKRWQAIQTKRITLHNDATDLTKETKKYSKKH